MINEMGIDKYKVEKKLFGKPIRVWWDWKGEDPSKVRHDLVSKRIQVQYRKDKTRPGEKQNKRGKVGCRSQEWREGRGRGWDDINYTQEGQV